MSLTERRPSEIRAVTAAPPEIETREAPAVHADAHSPQPQTRLQRALDVVIPALEERVRDVMPPGAFRDYYLWGLNPSNAYHDAWISVIGLKQIVEFTIQSVAFPFADAQIPMFAHYAAPMINYLNFEVVSDNLEFGLNDSGAGDRTYYLRAHLIREFSNAMHLRLNGVSTPAAELLAREEPLARRISHHVQSISPEKHHDIAEAFLNQHPGVSPRALETGLLPLLVMNIETAADLVQRTRHHITGSLIQQGLSRRYRSAERIFRDPNLDLKHVVSHSAYTILLIPVLSYYIELSAKALGISDRLERALRNGDLPRALYQCSVLVRLLNDLGTPVIMQSREDRRALLNQLREDARRGSQNNIRAFLRREVAQTSYRSLLTRVAKDVETGEFNVALYNLPHINPLDQALVTFGERLAALSRIYHRTDAEFERQLTHLSDTLGTDAVSRMIRRAVDFHFEMYNNDYRAENGDFAV